MNSVAEIFMWRAAELMEYEDVTRNELLFLLLVFTSRAAHSSVPALNNVCGRLYTSCMYAVISYAGIASTLLN